MANPMFPDVGNQDTLQQVRITLGEISQLLNWLFQGNIDSLNIRRLTADLIKAGTIDAGKVTIRADLVSGAYITIDGSGMVVYNGTDETFKVDINGFVTLTGAMFQSSASSYPRVEIDPSGTPIIRVSYTLTDILDINSSYSGGPPAVVIRSGGNPHLVIAENGGAASVFSLNGFDLQILSGNNLFVSANGGNLNLKDRKSVV